MSAALKKQVCDIVDGLSADLLHTSHAIHENPELAFEEKEAAALLVGESKKAGLEVQSEAFGLPTAYAAQFGTGGKEVAILSEYDALPGIGHACGHNIIAAAGLGAALALAKLGSALPGRVRYLGTPAEEAGGGKELMAQHGAFDKADAAMMIHPAGLNLRTIPSLCIYEVEVIYHGKNAHASASPWKGINALDGVVTAYQAIAQLRQHIRPNERVHGIITEGGQAPNIVPDRAAANFYIRAANASALFELRDKVVACFAAGAAASGARAELVWGNVVYLDVKHNDALSHAFADNAGELGLSMADPADFPSSYISTDMGNVSYRLPSIHPMLAVAPPHISIHHPDFARYAAQAEGDKAVIAGAKTLAMTALDFMLDEKLQAQTAEGFAAQSKNAKKILEEIKQKPSSSCGHTH